MFCARKRKLLHWHGPGVALSPCLQGSSYALASHMEPRSHGESDDATLYEVVVMSSPSWSGHSCESYSSLEGSAGLERQSRLVREWTYCLRDLVSQLYNFNNVAHRRIHLQVQ